MSDVLLKINDVADRIGVPVNTLRYWRSHGLGPKSARIGRWVAYREHDVDAWIASQFGDEGSRLPSARSHEELL
jgi:DNA-binding transcriptional MerR regulator